MGWAVTLTLSLLFTGALVALFFSAILGPGVFLAKELLSWEGALACGCNWVGIGAWVWDQAFPQTLGMSSFPDYGRIGTEPCAPRIANIIWVVLSLLNVWIRFIILTFISTSTVSNGSRHLKYPCRKLHSGF